MKKQYVILFSIFLVTVNQYVRANNSDTESRKKVVKNTAAFICKGDSLLIDGKYQKTTGKYQEIKQYANYDEITYINLISLSKPSIIPSASKTRICQGRSVTLNARGGVSYQWSHGIQNNQSFKPKETTTYSVTGTTANGCKSTSKITIHVENVNLELFASKDAIIEGDPVVLYARGADIYLWNDDKIKNGKAFYPTKSKKYTVLGNTKEGCSASKSVHITVSAKLSKKDKNQIIAKALIQQPKEDILPVKKVWTLKDSINFLQEEIVRINKECDQKSATTKYSNTYSVDKISFSETKRRDTYHIVVGCFASRKNAQELVNEMKKTGKNAAIVTKRKGLYVVSYASFKNKNQALSEITSARRINKNAWILRF